MDFSGLLSTLSEHLSSHLRLDNIIDSSEIESTAKIFSTCQVHQLRTVKCCICS